MAEVYDKDRAIAKFLGVCAEILTSLKPVIEHAAKEYLQQASKRAVR